MNIPQVTPTEAKEKLDSDAHAIYVDVRSVQEFVAGHPEGAINIPIFHKNPATMQMIPNDDFILVTTANLAKDKTLVIGCQAGGRSQRACEILAAQGYGKVFNVMGGFGGGLNPMTGGSQAGWKQLGLPISTDNSPAVNYDALSSKVKKM